MAGVIRPCRVHQPFTLVVSRHRDHSYSGLYLFSGKRIPVRPPIGGGFDKNSGNGSGKTSVALVEKKPVAGHSIGLSAFHDAGDDP